MSIVTFGCSAMYSSATSCQSDSPGSLFWMCHHSISTGSPESGASVPGASVPGASVPGASVAAGSEPGAVDAAGASDAAGAASSSSSPPHDGGDEGDDTDEQRGAAGSGAVHGRVPLVSRVPRASVAHRPERCQSLSITLSTPIYGLVYARRRVPAGDE